MSVPSFAKESDLCTAFIAALPSDWTAYPETGGFDIVLVRADGFQIGVEAKLKLNAKVICQAAEHVGHHCVASPGPDCRAVLIPQGVSIDLAGICPLIGITVIRMRPVPHYGIPFQPYLPKTGKSWAASGWYELAPASRIVLPDWVPDVSAGCSAPVALTDWKIKAIKIAVTLDKRGFVTRADFKHFAISMSRWTQERWLAQDGRGGWVAGRNMPDFRAQHPVNFPQIEADYEKWKAPEREKSEKQAALL